MKSQNTPDSPSLIPQTSTVTRIWIVVALIGCTFPNGWAQTWSPNPVIEQNHELSRTADKANKSEEPAPVVNEQDKDDSAKPQKKKRGSWIIAPIPISSPAIGSGLVLALGYVFKLQENDEVAPGELQFSRRAARGLERCDDVFQCRNVDLENA